MHASCCKFTGRISTLNLWLGWGVVTSEMSIVCNSMLRTDHMSICKSNTYARTTRCFKHGPGFITIYYPHTVTWLTVSGIPQWPFSQGPFVIVNNFTRIRTSIQFCTVMKMLRIMNHPLHDVRILFLSKLLDKLVGCQDLCFKLEHDENFAMWPWVSSVIKF